MTVAGWLFMGVSLVLVWGLAGWCFYRVLSGPKPPPDSERR